ncbi:MAG: hypothetical protein HOO93_02340 [Methyloglobulus sp.]|nr:hypothetical protein [Methyloglobulus sp.]
MALQIVKNNKVIQNFPPEIFGKDSQEIAKALSEIPLWSKQKVIKDKDKFISLEDKLYESRAYCKIEISKVAMYLPNEWRTHFFKQLDNLMDAVNWEADDPPITGASFNTFLRMLLELWPVKHPGLGVSNDGNIIAAWTTGRDRLTIECFPNDKVRWVVSRYLEDERESAAVITQVSRLIATLQPYSPSDWFDIDKK